MTARIRLTLLWKIFVALGSCTLLAGAGCQHPAVHVPRGESGVVVRVRAEPKAGYHPPGAGSDYNDPSPVDPPDPTGRYTRIDYDAVDDIVVWLEPVDGATTTQPTPPPEAVRIELPSDRSSPAPASRRAMVKGPGASPDAPLRAIAVGSTVVVHNAAARDDGVALRDEDGDVVDLGVVASGAEVRHVVSRIGLVEVVADSSDRPVARLYVVPSGWSRVARSGQQVTFAPLPPGQYRVCCWHPRLPGSRRTVELTADHVARVDAVVSVNVLSKTR